jgi:signal peptidase I
LITHGTIALQLRIYGRDKETFMNAQGKNSGRNTLAAVFLGFTMPGLGQIYNGELSKGISLFILVITLGAAGIRAALLLPDNLLIYGTLLAIAASGGLHIFAIVEAFNQASRTEVAFQLKPYNRWYVYLAVWLLGSILSGIVQGYVRDNYIEAYKVPTSSMEPGVRQGDRVLADKTAYHRMAPRKGDVVIFANPDNRSQMYVKRVEALPGNAITRPDGIRETVPHGFAYVLGDNHDRSIDSRQFGFIPLRDIVAKVRQVYFSSGPQDIRWRRIGAVVGSGR